LQDIWNRRIVPTAAPTAITRASPDPARACLP
jgi:hypothetical protein